MFFYIAETASVQSLYGINHAEESPNFTGQGAGREPGFKAGGSGASCLSQRVQQKANRSGLKPE
jgi:hypothetical protein